MSPNTVLGFQSQLRHGLQLLAHTHPGEQPLIVLVLEFPCPTWEAHIEILSWTQLGLVAAVNIWEMNLQIREPCCWPILSQMHTFFLKKKLLEDEVHQNGRVDQDASVAEAGNPRWGWVSGEPGGLAPNSKRGTTQSATE